MSLTDDDSVSVNLAPKDISQDDFEELLATDRMFRDCFNEYLSQPIFTETLHFNPVTFAFELKSSERENVVSMIRDAVYSARPKPHLQKVSTFHAFRPITLIPMEFDMKEPPNIKSEFSIELLESESANEWIKRNRLPMFLNSDLYHYYRMGSLLAQAASVYRASGRTSVIFNNSPHIRKARPVRKSMDYLKMEREETYVSHGQSAMTNSEQRYAQSQMGRSTSTTFSTDFNTPRLSELMSRPKSARPSRGSTVPSRPESVALSSTTPVSEMADSGRDSSGDELTNVPPCDKTPQNRDIGSPRSIIPLPSELICVAEQSPLGPLEMRLKVEEESSTVSNDASSGVGTSVASNMEKLILAADVNEGLGGLEKCRDPEIAQALINAIRKTFHSKKVAPDALLSRLMLNPQFERIVNNIPNAAQVVTLDIQTLIERAEMLEQEAGEVESISGDIFPEEEKEFNEDGQDVSSIANFKLLKAFEDFMKKSSGWPVFSLWLDIDRLKRKYDIEAMHLTPPIRQFLSSMRQRYLRPGSEYCLSISVQTQMDLSDPIEWTVEHLQEIQPQLMQTLLSYWAVRFFVHESSRSKEFLKNNASYQLYQNEQVGHRPVYPTPKAPSILPLRPKSCLPRYKPLETPPKPSRFNPSVTQVVLTPREPEMPQRRSYLVPLEPETRQESPEKSRPATPVTRAKTAPPGGRAITPADINNNRENDVKSSLPVADPFFYGGDRMERLLVVLKTERLTGQFVEQFIRQTNNKSWLNALLFWLELQKYHKFFTKDIVPDGETAKSLATHLYSTYLMSGANDEITIEKGVASRISKHLDPPYEELFDEAEEQVILILYEAMEAIEKESSSMIGNIPRHTLSRKIETGNPEILQLNALGLFKKAAVLPKEDDSLADTSNQLLSSDNTLWQQVPEQFRDWTLERIVFNRVELEAFRVFLEQNNVASDLFCWMDIESYRRLPPGSDQIMHVKAVDIKDKYLNRKYFFGATSPANKREQTKILEENGGWAKLMAVVPPPALLIEVQTYARRRLDSKWLPLFLASAEFAERQKPIPTAPVEDEQVALKRRRAAQIAKMLEGHWSATAQEALMFRNALTSEDTRKLFYRFLKLRAAPGEFLPNDLLFYDEVQKYKQLYHTHADESLVNAKISQIVTCYLEDNHKQPPLQIDIPQEMAEKIVWHKKELGAYLFRDAQLTVFRILLSHWADFCRFRETVPTVPERKVKTIRIDGKVYPMKSLPPVAGIDPKHFMEVLERRKIVLDRKRFLKEKEEKSSEGSVQGSVKDGAAAANQKVPGEEDEDYNPFGSQNSLTERRRVWRYSEYQYMLERELLLNNTNRSTFMLDEGEYSKAVEFFPNLFDANTST